MFRNVHPTRTAGKQNVQPKPDGFGQLAKDQSDETRRNCRQCGFPVDTRKNAQGPGTGIRYDESGDEPVPVVGKYSGCSFCGSKNY